jgi:hypothetical protein
MQNKRMFNVDDVMKFDKQFMKDFRSGGVLPHTSTLYAKPPQGRKELKMKTFIIKNLITGELKGRVTCNSLAAAQEHFDALMPNMTGHDMLFEVKQEQERPCYNCGKMSYPKCGAITTHCEWCNTDRSCVFIMEPCEHQLPKVIQAAQTNSTATAHNNAMATAQINNIVSLLRDGFVEEAIGELESYQRLNNAPLNISRTVAH